MVSEQSSPTSFAGRDCALAVDPVGVECTWLGGPFYHTKKDRQGCHGESWSEKSCNAQGRNKVIFTLQSEELKKAMDRRGNCSPRKWCVYKLAFVRTMWGPYTATGASLPHHLGLQKFDQISMPVKERKNKSKSNTRNSKRFNFSCVGVDIEPLKSYSSTLKIYCTKLFISWW